MSQDIELDANEVMDDGPGVDLGLDTAEGGSQAPITESDNDLYTDDDADGAQSPASSKPAEGATDTGEVKEEEQPAATAVDPAIKAAMELMDLDEETAKALHSSGKLDAVAKAFDLKFLKAGQEAMAGGKPAEKPAEAKVEEKPAEDPFKLDWTAEDDVEVHPTIKKNVEAVRDGMVTAFRGIVGPLMQQFNDLRSQIMTERLDNQFSALGDDWKDVFGKGTFDELDKKSEQYQNRVKLVETIAQLDAGMRATGKDGGSVANLFKRAQMAAFGDKIKTMVRQELTNQGQQRRNQIIGKPTQRRTLDKADPLQGTIDKVAAKMRLAGLDPGETKVDVTQLGL